LSTIAVVDGEEGGFYAEGAARHGDELKDDNYGSVSSFVLEVKICRAMIDGS